MMSLAIMIASTPSLCFHNGIPPNGAPPLSYARLISIPTIYSEAPVGGGGENMNGQVWIANGDGALTSLMSIPPLGAAVTITRDSIIIMSGTISKIQVSDTIQLTIEG